MKLRDTYVQALGVYLPEVMSTRRAVDLGLYEEEELLNIGITGVLVAPEDLGGVDMSVLAARDALSRAGVVPSTVDLAVHAGVFWQGPEGWTPTGYVLRELGCPDVPGFEVRQGCNGVLAALELAVGQFALDPTRSTALLTTGQTFNSPVIDRWHAGGSGVLMSDAACAVVLSTRAGFARVQALNSTLVPELEGMYRGAESLLEPRTPVRPMVDLGARMVDFARLSDYPFTELAARVIKAHGEVIAQTLAEAGLDLTDLARVLHVNIPHVAEMFVMSPLGLDMKLSTMDFGRTVGHLSACDQVASLHHLLTTGQLRAGDHVLVTGTAPGFSVAAAVLTIDEVPAWARSGDGASIAA
ncbi:MAG: hypothetical protein AUI14_13080 [Actinobacteria bacterium 13_2_20CM_2_71_6]|nr:MAG: hypothetical protein AUI14_13080 [Actinobacteria bacterium 13_2_20CM_2_71_6]